jgi:hypothetical protein
MISGYKTLHSSRHNISVHFLTKQRQGKKISNFINPEQWLVLNQKATKTGYQLLAHGTHNAKTFSSPYIVTKFSIYATNVSVFLENINCN